MMTHLQNEMETKHKGKYRKIKSKTIRMSLENEKKLKLRTR